MISSYQRVERAFGRLANVAYDALDAPFVSLGSDLDVDEVFLGKGPSGTYRLWARLPRGRERTELRSGSILTIEWDQHPDLGGGNDPYLRVSCQDPRLNRTFLSLIAEMLDEVEGTSRPVFDAVLKVIDAWHEFLRSRKGEFDRNEAIGLFGELTVLRRLAAFDPGKAAQCWRGAENYRHDFNRTNSLEVKTYTGYGDPRIQIHGAYQLEPPKGQKLHLVAFKVDENASGEALADIVDHVVAKGVPRGGILRKLNRSMEDLERLKHHFIIEETRLFEVTAEFPGIRPSNLTEDALVGVDGLSYSLALDQCTGRVPAEQLDRILETL